MGNKIVTEADRKATKPLPGAPRIKAAGGQKRSLERGSHIRSKKNPGKRPHQGTCTYSVLHFMGRQRVISMLSISRVLPKRAAARITRACSAGAAGNSRC